MRNTSITPATRALLRWSVKTWMRPPLACMGIPSVGASWCDRGFERHGLVVGGIGDSNSEAQRDRGRARRGADVDAGTKTPGAASAAAAARPGRRLDRDWSTAQHV